MSKNLAHYLSLVEELRTAARQGKSCGALLGYLDESWQLLTPAEKAERIALL